MDFVAIDFETATSNANSACQLATVSVRNGEIEGEDCWLIRPPRLHFSSRNIAIHGIRPQDVRNAPTMAEVWSELAGKLEGRVLIAHNARFDIGVLINSLAFYDLACPRLDFSCTRVLARGAWPGRKSYGLKPLGNWLGISFQHHDALEDARCCARIALAVADCQKKSSLEDLETDMKITRGNCQDGRVFSPRLIGRKRQVAASGSRTTDRWGFPAASRVHKPAGVDPESIMAASADAKPLNGKQLVLLGPLRGLSLEASHDLVCKLGGRVQTAIGLDTNFVIACGTPLEAAGLLVCEAIAEIEGSGDSVEAGGIRILSERQFRALLPGGKAAAWR